MRDACSAGSMGQQTGGRVGNHDERSDTSSSRADSAEGESNLDSLPPASPLPSPPHSLLGVLSLGDCGRDAEAWSSVPQWRRKVKSGTGYENECRSKTYEYVTECGGGGVLPLPMGTCLHNWLCADGCQLCRRVPIGSGTTGSRGKSWNKRNKHHTHTHTSSHETRGNQSVVLPPAKPPQPPPHRSS